MIFSAAARTDVGMRRSANEDAYALVPELGLFLVADGMGGHLGGQRASHIASETTVAAMRRLAGRPGSFTEKLRFCLAEANREIFETAQRKPELSGMGTTLVAVLASGGRLALLHVGDSRAYLIRRGRIRQLTDDHSLVAEMVRRREITPGDAREHPHRHVLTRAVGVRRSVEGDLAELTPEDGDLVVLCSDGLTGHVNDREIGAVSAQGRDLETACGDLVDLANDRGGDDNITVVIVRIDSAS